eukprot:7209061-Karenia_brevis.AAC.1
MLRHCGFDGGLPMHQKKLRTCISQSSLEKIESGTRTAVMSSKFVTGGLRNWRAEQVPQELRSWREGLWMLGEDARKAQYKEYKKRMREWRAKGKGERLRKVAEYKRRQTAFIPPSTFIVDGRQTGDRG